MLNKFYSGLVVLDLICCGINIATHNYYSAAFMGLFGIYWLRVVTKK